MVCVLEMILLEKYWGIDDFCIVIVQIMRAFERLTEHEKYRDSVISPEVIGRQINLS